MSKLNKLFQKDVGELFSGLFKESLHGLTVLLGILIAVGVYLWIDYKSYQEEHGEAPYGRVRTLYVVGGSIVTVLFCIFAESWKRFNKRRKRKRYFKRIGNQRKPKLRSDG